MKADEEYKAEQKYDPYCRILKQIIYENLRSLWMPIQMAEEEKKATTMTTKFSASLSAVEGEADGDDGWGTEGDWGDEW